MHARAAVVCRVAAGLDRARRRAMLAFAGDSVAVRKLSSIVQLPLLPSRAEATIPDGEDDLLEAYARASPEAAEVFAAWDTIKRRTSRVMINLLDFLSVLVKWGPESLALFVCRKVLRNRNKAMFSQLGSEHGRLIISTLTLLACIGQHSPATARELLSRFNFGSRIFHRLTQRKQGNKGRRRGRVKDVAKARVDEVRDAFAQLVLALLRVPAPDVQRQIVSTRGLVRGVIHLVASSNSGPSLPIVALSTLLTCVVRNAGVPSHAKRKVLDGSTLEVVTRLYASGGAVRDAVHAFLSATCCGDGSTGRVWTVFGTPPAWRRRSVAAMKLNARLRLALRFATSLNVRSLVARYCRTVGCIVLTPRVADIPRQPTTSCRRSCVHASSPGSHTWLRSTSSNTRTPLNRGRRTAGSRMSAPSPRCCGWQWRRSCRRPSWSKSPAVTATAVQATPQAWRTRSPLLQWRTARCAGLRMLRSAVPTRLLSPRWPLWMPPPLAHRATRGACWWVSCPSS